MTSSMYRRITNYKEENTRKWPQMGFKGPEFKILKNKNKNVPRSTVPKMMFLLCQKLIPSCRDPMSHGLFLSWIREHTRGRSRSRPKQNQSLAQSAIKDHFQRFQQYLYFFPMYAYCKDRTYKMYFLALKRLFEFCSDIDLDSTSSSTWIYRTIVGIFSLNIDSKN